MSERPRAAGPLDWAVATGDGLLRRAVRSGTEAAWPARDFDTGRPVSPYPADLYDGAGGVGIFLGLLGRETGLERFRRTGAAALNYSLRRLKAGAATGLPGLAGAGQAALLQDRAAEAVRLGERLLATGPGEPLELLQGAAGIGTFHLSLFRRTGEKRWLRAALRRADRIANADPSAWHEAGGTTLGYAHGPAGIGEFLLRCWALGGRPAHRDAAALCALLVDRLRARDKTSTTSRWCRGTPGLLLFEQAAAEILGGAARRRKAERRAEAVLEGVIDGSEGMLCYCHGAAGGLDALLEFGWDKIALEGARKMVLPAANRSRTGLSFPGFAGRPPSAGLYQGDAGIGWLFLRLANPRIPLFYRVLPP